MISFESAGARVLINASPDGTIVSGEDDHVVVWNPACERIFGWSQAEVLGQRVSDLIIPQELRRPHLAGVRRLTQAGKTTGVSAANSNILDRRIEIDAVRKNGQRFPIELMVSMFQEGDNIYYVARLRDITEQREAERIHTLMMHELNHRVRNSLAIAQSITTNTLTNEKVDRTIIRKVGDRIGALGKAHLILSEENWQSGSLWPVVNTALGAYEDQLAIHGPNVVFGPTTVVTTSLLLHELAANSVKYGALSVPTGKVNLSWFTAGNLVHMFWAETGGPPVHKPLHTGFGTKMIQRLVSAEQGAAIDFNFDPAGLKVEVELPFFDAN